MCPHHLENHIAGFSPWLDFKWPLLSVLGCIELYYCIQWCSSICNISQNLAAVLMYSLTTTMLELNFSLNPQWPWWLLRNTASNCENLVVFSPQKLFFLQFFYFLFSFFLSFFHSSFSFFLSFFSVVHDTFCKLMKERLAHNRASKFQGRIARKPRIVAQSHDQ